MVKMVVIVFVENHMSKRVYVPFIFFKKKNQKPKRNRKIYKKFSVFFFCIMTFHERFFAAISQNYEFAATSI